MRADRRFLIMGVVGAGAAAAALIAASLVFSGGDNGDKVTPPAELVVSGLPQSGTVLGAADSPVTLIVYEDIQCPFCGMFSVDAFPEIVATYVATGKVKLDFRGLDFLGPDSTKALRLVLAAAHQNRAWHLVELLYRDQGGENTGWVTDELLERLAGEAGLDADRAFSEAGSADVAKAIQAVASEAAARGVGGTPTFFVQIGDAEAYRVEVADLTFGAFRPILDDALRG